MALITPELQSVLEKFMLTAGNSDPAIAGPAQSAIAAAINTPLRQAVLPGDIYSNIFNREPMKMGTVQEYQMDIIAPGNEANFIAFTMPDVGRIPDRHVKADRIFVNTYRIANAIDTSIRILKTMNYNVIARMMEVLEYGFVQKLNDDAWSVIISAGNARGLMVYDADAAAGQFTPRLIQLAKTIMRRNGGGNSASTNRGRLTDVYLSPEAKDDIRSWGLDLVPDAVRAQIFYGNENGREFMKVYDVNIHDIDELGVGQKYQLYYTSTLAGSLAASDVELAVGLDLANNDAFVMPVSQEIEVREDMTLHRQGRVGYYGSMEPGFACLDSRRAILLSM